MHVATCVDFEIDLDTGKSDCIKHDPNDIAPEDVDDAVSNKTLEMSAKRGELHRAGYE